MIRRRLAMLSALGALVLGTALFVSACSNSANTTNPPGGGGGVPGPTFSFTFPATGASHDQQFPNAGTFGYHCIPHQSSGMTGTVTVDGTGADSIVVNVGNGGANMFAPQNAHIKPGGYVRWVLVSATTIHTVTND